MRRALLGSALTALLMGTALAFAPPAGATDLSLPTDTVVYAEPGSLIELGRAPVDTDLAGPLCTWEATVTNQNSAHPGNDIIITSGDSELVLSEVEATEGKVTTNEGSAYLSSEVVVTLRMGPDGVFSGGLDLTIRYDQCTTPTTVPETTVPETTVPETTVPTTPVPTTPVPTTPVLTTVVEGELEPLGPTVTTEPSTTTTSVEIAPAGPVLPVTGGSNTIPMSIGGAALVAIGAASVITTRRVAR